MLATPVPTHGPLAERVLQAGKHCFVEKPLAYTVEDAERAVRGGQGHDRILMVGHLLVYHPGVDKLKEIADSGELGDIHYIYSQRLNLGQLRTRRERAVVARRPRRLGDPAPRRRGPLDGRGARRGVHAPGRRGRRVRVPALPVRASPRTCTCRGWTRTRRARFTVVGAKRMATFDDMELERKVTVYDKGFDQDAQSYGEYITRSGDIRSPRIANREPLRLECEHFVERIRDGTRPAPTARRALRVVASASLQRELEQAS